MFRVIEKHGFKDFKYFGNKIPSNTEVYLLSGDIKDTPTRTSIQIGSNQHVEDFLGKYINHNCYPTVKIVNSKLISVKQINNGDSIIFDYNESEDIISNPFICHCCGKRVLGRLALTGSV